MEKQIEQLIKYAKEAWSKLDHNEHELLVSRLYMSIEAVKSAKQGVQADVCQSCGAIGMFDQDECSVCGIHRQHKPLCLNRTTTQYKPRK